MRRQIYKIKKLELKSQVFGLSTKNSNLDIEYKKLSLEYKSEGKKLEKALESISRLEMELENLKMDQGKLSNKFFTLDSNIADQFVDIKSS